MAEERVQKRLAAILAADFAGYSRQMGADPGLLISQRRPVSIIAAITANFPAHR